jgi:hypothetical protein
VSLALASQLATRMKSATLLPATSHVQTPVLDSTVNALVVLVSVPQQSFSRLA